MSLSFWLCKNMPVGINNYTYFLCLITSGSESELFCATPKKGLVEFCFVVCGVCVTLCLLTSVGLLFCAFSMTGNTEKSKHSACQSLIIPPCTFPRHLCLYFYRAHTCRYILTCIWFWITEIWMGLMLSLQVRQCGVIYLMRSLWDDGLVSFFTHSFLLQEKMLFFNSELILWFTDWGWQTPDMHDFGASPVPFCTSKHKTYVSYFPLFPWVALFIGLLTPLHGNS